ncbi:DUF3488 and transglutaminase-like domain-containing protein [Granulosicoccaceae sp. 1_MG-2023]|nr:DUF3488 and transglutaminase-like domain-containing protein [Granulosicoccaceae sp. 1_MG-2023]
MKNSGGLITRAGLYWLTALMLLTQLPHVFNLPWWISLSSVALVLAKLALHRHGSDRRWFRPAVVVALALLGAFLLHWQYGYLLGRDPCVALLSLLMALKFSETRQRRDVTLLICLAGFLLFTRFFYSQSPLTAALTLPALLAMGGCLYVLRDQTDYPGLRAVLLLVGKLLIQGIPLAAILFVLFPRLTGPLWSLPADAGTALSGLSDSLAPGMVSQLSRSGEVAFRVEFDDAPPAQADLYWRGPVFEVFDGHRWSGAQQNLLTEPQTVPAQGELSHYTVTLEAHRQRWLFALDQAVTLPQQLHGAVSQAPLARLSQSRQLLATRTVDSAIRYRLSSAVSDRFGDLQPALQRNLQLNDNNPATLALGRRLRAEHADDSELVGAALRYFREQPFFYTLRPDLLGDAPVDEFLFRTRRGFCEHYASAFSYLMRAAGIPARVVTGYQGGEMNGDYLIVRQSNAHAWSEVWLNNHWQRIDPTAAVAPSRIESGPAAALAHDEPVPSVLRPLNGWMHSLQLGADALNYRWRRYVVDFGAERQRSLFEFAGFPSPQPWQVLSVILLLAGLWALVILKLPALRLPRTHDAATLWARYRTRLKSAGLALGKQHGPNGVCEMATEIWPRHRQHFAAISQAYIQARYSADSRDPALRREAERRLREALRALPSAYQLRRSHPAHATTGHVLWRFQHWLTH